MSAIWARTTAWLRTRRSLIGKFAFELAIVFVGVTAAFAMEGLRQQAEEDAYRRGMIAAMIPTLENVLSHNRDFDREVVAELAAFDAAIARGEQPPLPVFREQGSERPPTRAWDAIVATGAAKALPPKTFFQLALFYTRQESIGERYIRYNDFTEQRVFALGPAQAAAYDPITGLLRPEFVAYVDRLRDLKSANDQISLEAAALKDELTRLGR